MNVQELAAYIRNNKEGINYPRGHLMDDVSVINQYTRHEMCGLVHITDKHILECCEKATTYEEHIVLCKPFAIKDTEDFKREQAKPAPKGRTKRKFR